jgi:hypothetical protein
MISCCRRPWANCLELRIIAREFRRSQQNRRAGSRPPRNSQKQLAAGGMPCWSVGRSTSTTDHLPALAQSRAQPPEEAVGSSTSWYMWTMKIRRSCSAGNFGVVGGCRGGPRRCRAARAAPAARADHAPRRRCPRPARGPCFADPLGEAHGVIPVARTDIGHGQALGDPARYHHRARLVAVVALLLGPRTHCPRARTPADRPRGNSREVSGRSASGSACRRPSTRAVPRRARRAKRYRIRLLDILHLDRLAGHALRQRRGDEGLDLAVEHVARRGRGDAGPEVLDQLVRLEDVAPDLVAPSRSRSWPRTRSPPPPRAWPARLRRGRALSMPIAVARFLCWLRSCWLATTIPVGTWVSAPRCRWC